MPEETQKLALCYICGSAAKLTFMGDMTWKVACTSAGVCQYSGILCIDKQTAIRAWNILQEARTPYSIFPCEVCDCDGIISSNTEGWSIQCDNKLYLKAVAKGATLFEALNKWNGKKMAEEKETTYPIEKDIPIENFPGSGGPKYNELQKEYEKMPFEQLSIGDSFFIPFTIVESNTVIASLCTRKTEKLDRAFSYRKDKTRGGFRVWRVPTAQESRLFDNEGNYKGEENERQ